MTPELPRRIERINYLLVAVLGAIGLVFLAQPHALGLVVGALIAALHFSGLRWVVERMRRAPPSKQKAAGVLLAPHLLLTMGAVVLALAYLPLSGGALLVGFSVFLVSIVAGAAQDALAPEGEGEDSGASSS